MCGPAEWSPRCNPVQSGDLAVEERTIFAQTKDTSTRNDSTIMVCTASSCNFKFCQISTSKEESFMDAGTGVSCCLCGSSAHVLLFLYRRQVEYGFGEYGLNHRAQWVSCPSLSSRERTQWVPFCLWFAGPSKFTQLFRWTHRVRRRAQWVLDFETVLLQILDSLGQRKNPIVWTQLLWTSGLLS